MNQRLNMNIVIALTVLFLGIITVFVVWAFQWVLESRKEITFDMPGEVSALTVMESPEIVTAYHASMAQKKLMSFIRDNELSLIISSIGLSHPEMIVYDPHGFLSWFPDKTSEEHYLNLNADRVYLFEGTYSERRWSESVVTPLLPEGLIVDGVIVAPYGINSLQWVRQLDIEPLAPGNYTFTFNTVDPIRVRYIVDLLLKMGFYLQQTLKIPLAGYLIFNPLFIITTFFLVMGHVCAMLYWFFYQRRRIHEFLVRRCYGAVTSSLVWENLVNAMPGLLIGVIASVILSGCLLTSIGQIAITPKIFWVLAAAGLIAAVSTAAAWSAILYTALTFNRTRR